MATKKGKKASQRKVQYSAKVSKQLQAVIWFAASIFLLFVVFVKGENVWTFLHNSIFGILGFTAYLFPFLIGTLAIVSATDKKQLKTKAVMAAVIVLLVGVLIEIITTSKGCEDKFFEHLTNVFDYCSTKTGAGGGFLGALLGYPLFMLFGKTGAIVTVILIMFVLLMIITGTTLMSLFKTVSKPVKAVSEHAENAFAERLAKTEGQENNKKQLKVIKGFDVDIPVDEPTKRKKRTESLDEKQKKLVDSYYADDETAEKEDSYIPENDTAEVEEALDNIREQAEEAKPERISVDFKKETDEVTEEISEHTDSMPIYKYPPLELLNSISSADSKSVAAELESTADRLVETLRSFGVETRVVDVSRGPTVTRYELQPRAGVKISKITSLADDIALNLATAGVRIEAPIPNKAAVGIEVPNRSSATVGVREIIESNTFSASKSKLTVSMGKDIGGNVIVADIAKMPHGLIAGATGSGKSVCINSFIISLLYKASPDDVKLLMIDPKVVELGIYNGIPHLLVPVVTEPRKAAGALGWAVNEMEQRYKMFADRDVRNIEGYNKFVETLVDEPEVKKLPRIVIIIDELADLMMTAPKEVEDSINRIAAKARAAGIHLLIATQRPSVNVVTGVIKANIPTRIAFSVSSHIDSGTILDCAGAEKLLGRGDMLFSPVGATKPMRIQGCFVSDEEVERVVNFVKNGAAANYDDNIMVEIERNAALEKQKQTGLAEDAPEGDTMLEDAIKVVVENGQASASLLQRKLKLGYARAARIMDEMEERGIIGPYEGAKPRKVLITKDELMERQATQE